MTPILILLVGMLIFMFLGVPLAFAILGISTIVFITFTDISFWQIIQRFFSGIDSFVLTAIPFFLLAGNLMNYGKISDRLVDLASALVGHIRGGLAQINVLDSLFFGGISGSAVADTSGIGSMIIPQMIKRGYSPEFTVAITATTSVLGQIIPPSLIMIIYAATANTSVQAMFLAGIIPGVLFALVMMAVSYGYAVKYNYPREKRKTFKEFLHILKDSVIVLVMPLIIMGGVLACIFTATESAVVAVVYSLVITLFVEKTLTIKELGRILVDTAKSSAASLFCIGAASVFGYLMAYFRVNVIVGDLMTAMNLSANAYILFVVVLFFILGLFMDATPAIYIFVPIVIPLGEMLGIHPVHLGMIVCLVLAFGMVTPPYGLCLLLACQFAKVPVRKTLKDMGIMLLPIFLMLLVIVYVPDIIMFLPRIFAARYV